MWHSAQPPKAGSEPTVARARKIHKLTGIKPGSSRFLKTTLYQVATKGSSIAKQCTHIDICDTTFIITRLGNSFDVQRSIVINKRKSAHTEMELNW